MEQDRFCQSHAERRRSKGWLLDVFRCQENQKEEFSLDDVYAFEGDLRQSIHPTIL